MTTIKLKVNDKILDKVMELLAQFNSEEIEVIQSDQNFEANQNYLKKELDIIKNGGSKSISIDALDDILEKAIREYED